MKQFLMSPETGKWAHGALSFISGLLIVVIPLLIDNLTGPSPIVALSAGVLIIVAAALQYTLSRLRNAMP